ncbi:integrase, partial [Enterobacter cloacae]
SVDQIIDELRRVSVYAKEAPASFGASTQACPSLLKMRDLYLLQYSEKRKLTTLSKTNKAVKVLLTHLKKKDVQLRDINRTIVTGWLDK